MSTLESAAQPFFNSGFTTIISAGVTACTALVDAADAQAVALHTSTAPMSTYASMVTMALMGLFGVAMLPAVFVLLGTLFILGKTAFINNNIIIGKCHLFANGW